MTPDDHPSWPTTESGFCSLAARAEWEKPLAPRRPRCNWPETLLRASYLLVSTDPAHSVMDSLAGSMPPPNLQVTELDAQQCLAAFKSRHGSKFHAIASRGTFLDHYDINCLLDLSLPGLDEVMASLEIAGWVAAHRYQTIVVDTAPTGHTLRLLAMPALLHNWLEALDALLAKHRYMRKLFSGAVTSATRLMRSWRVWPTRSHRWKHCSGIPGAAALCP